MCRARLLVWGLALSTAGCETPAPPPLAVHAPSLDAGDLAVMKGLLDDQRKRAAPARPRFVVVDTTLAKCSNRLIATFEPPPGGCVNHSAIEELSRLLPQASVRTATLDFEARNARRLPIAGSLGPDVSYVSWTLADFSARANLLRGYPAGSALVAFSRPSYPAPHVAVIAYSPYGYVVGAARLAQQSDGRWEVDVATLPWWQPGVD
jgi:hypothetical protein